MEDIFHMTPAGSTGGIHGMGHHRPVIVDNVKLHYVVGTVLSLLYALGTSDNIQVGDDWVMFPAEYSHSIYGDLA